MTIKRRLVISNLLMIIIPIILTIFMSCLIMFVFIKVTGYENLRSIREGNELNNAKNKVEKIAENNIELSDIEQEIDVINQNYNQSNIKCYLLKNREIIYPNDEVSNNIFAEVVMMENDSYIIKNNIAIYIAKAGFYSIILIDTDFNMNVNNGLGTYFYLPILFFVLTIIIIFLTNRMLTHFVFHHIMNPLNTLVYGVRQISNGDLQYRIEYPKKDEFNQVCRDFNEMATHLYEMVNARQKDEKSRRELIAGISHDLRTPLTSIKAYIEGLEKGIATTPEIKKKYFDTIKSKTSDLEYIINQLFLFSKLDIGDFPLNMEVLDIGEELKHLVNTMREEYVNKGLTINVQSDLDRVYIELDRIQFRNVIQNIIENSRKYVKQEEKQVTIQCVENKENILLILTDNGQGVPEQSIDKIFNVFYRLDASRQNPSNGSGLGLSISSKIIERFGGSMKAENAKPNGLAIIIILPKYKGEGII